MSLHGGHSGEFCEHARGTLREILEAAVNAGFSVFGVTEHAPRTEDRFLYSSERDKGFTTHRLEQDFHAYAQAVKKLAGEYEEQLTVLCGFETEVVPTSNYVELSLGLREKLDFDYMLGSVHYVDEIQIDGSPGEFQRAAQKAGGLEKLAVRYYQIVGEMVRDLKPEVVGHFDLIRKLAPDPVDSAEIRQAARNSLELLTEHSCILDLNTAGYRKGLKTPYPEPWLVRMAHEMGLGFCFGDDSHSVQEVGMGIEDGRQYLLDNGVDSVEVLTRNSGQIVRRSVSLAGSQ